MYWQKLLVITPYKYLNKKKVDSKQCFLVKFIQNLIKLFNWCERGEPDIQVRIKKLSMWEFNFYVNAEGRTRTTNKAKHC